MLRMHWHTGFIRLVISSLVAAVQYRIWLCRNLCRQEGYVGHPEAILRMIQTDCRMRLRSLDVGRLKREEKTMVVMCRARNTDPLKKIKILLKQRKTGTKPKVKNASAKVKLSSMKNSTLTVDKTIPITSENKKRKFEASLECLLVKRSKLDHCQGTLTKMMKHKWSVQFLCNDGSTFSLKNDSLEVEASHVAKLKSRFADTILRAQSKIGNPCVEVKVIKLASQMKEEECRVKKQLEFERQAARASLEQMERSITLDDNLGAMRDLEVLMRSRMQLGRTENPLEKLGLFIKPEYKLGYDDDDDLFIQGVVLEEGEILNG